MENQPPIKCETCGAPINHIPAGISRKTGKPYKEFWSCSQRCGFSWRLPSRQDQNHEEIIEALRKLWLKLEEIEKRLNK